VTGIGTAVVIIMVVGGTMDVTVIGKVEVTATCVSEAVVVTVDPKAVVRTVESAAVGSMTADPEWIAGTAIVLAGNWFVNEVDSKIFDRLTTLAPDRLKATVMFELFPFMLIVAVELGAETVRYIVERLRTMVETEALGGIIVSEGRVRLMSIA